MIIGQYDGQGAWKFVVESYIRIMSARMLRVSYSPGCRLLIRCAHQKLKYRRRRLLRCLEEFLRKSGKFSAASADGKPNTQQVESANETDPNYFPTNRKQQIKKSAASKTSTLKEELKVLKCFSGRYLHENFEPKKMKFSGIEKWLD